MLQILWLLTHSVQNIFIKICINIYIKIIPANNRYGKYIIKFELLNLCKNEIGTSFQNSNAPNIYKSNKCIHNNNYLYHK